MVKIQIPQGCPFTIHNIPFGVISTNDNVTPRCATAIGSYAIDLAIYSQHGHLNHLNFQPNANQIFSQPSLNAFAAMDRTTRLGLRETLIYDIINEEVPENCLVELIAVTMHLPFRIGGFSDFYCSLEHVQNCSPMAANASIPVNWFYSPSVYNGRASSIVPSPQSIRRPRGVYFGKDDGKSVYGPSQEIDFELEMGFFVSKPVNYGSELNIEDAEDHIFGFVLLNDWSARDIQVFEMKPLGPFHGKGFGTSISNWVVTIEALQTFRCAPKTIQDPVPFSHLKWPGDKDGTFNIKLEIDLIRKGKRFPLATSNLRYLYWTPFQQITHHASAMCGIQTGDLIGTGTISGDAVDDKSKKIELGCLYEATQAGSKQVELLDGSQMMYLNDEDEIILKAWCVDATDESISLGFGECRGTILPANP